MKIFIFYAIDFSGLGTTELSFLKNRFFSFFKQILEKKSLTARLIIKIKLCLEEKRMSKFSTLCSAAVILAAGAFADMPAKSQQNDPCACLEQGMGLPSDKKCFPAAYN